MLAVETITARRASVKLNNGTDAQGNVKTISQSIGTLDASTWNADKAMAIMTALGPCLSKSIYSRHTSMDATLTAN